MAMTLIPLIGLTALSLADQCVEVKANTGVSEARCERLSPDPNGEIAKCTTDRGEKLRLFKSREDCQKAKIERTNSLPQLGGAPANRTPRAIPTH